MVVKELSIDPGYTIDKNGVVYSRKVRRNLNPVVKNGYQTVRVSVEGKVVHLPIHRLVYETFIGPINDGNHIHHINGIRSDNSIGNLEQVTPLAHSTMAVFTRKGEDINTSKITEADVMEIRRIKSRGGNSKALAERYGLSKSAINRIANGKTWKHLPLLPVDNSVWSDSRTTGAMAKKALIDRYGEEYYSNISKGNKYKKHCPTCTCCGGE